MASKLLKKGLEIELYAGTDNGEVMPLSTKLSQRFPEISQEPDERNFEYITKPTQDYKKLFKEIITPRIKVRKYLKELGNFTIIPGSTISLPFSKIFFHSKSQDPYHEFIFKRYKTSIITTSLHLNFGINDIETLFKLISALRLDTPLFLALSASSPFHDGKVTGYNSYRWHSFPKTPDFVPFFKTHNDFINWTNEQISKKNMFNVRHFWTSIRPNGPNRPLDLNRIEIRICDLVADTKKVLSIMAFVEVLIQQYLTNKNWPNILDKNTTELDELVKIIEKQEEQVAQFGLSAKIWDWRDDSKKEVYKIIESLYKNSEGLAKKLSLTEYLNPITNILSDGNEATHFLESYKKTRSIQTTMQHFTEQFTIMDCRYMDMIKNQVEVGL